ncbi:MAG: type VI secretion system tube protein Hcp [Novosphingobium sp.]
MSTTYYLKIDGIFGDSVSKSHAGWFEINSFSLGQSNPATLLSGISAGKVSFSDLSISLADNTLLSPLLLDLASGKMITGLEIEGVNGSGQVVYDLSFNDLLVSSLSLGAGSGSEPSTNISFAYSMIGLQTYEQKPDGTLATAQEFGWDLVANKPIDPDLIHTEPAMRTDPAGEPTAYFLKIDGIAGDSTAKGHEGWFELNATQFAAFNATVINSAGLQAGKAVFPELFFSLSDNTALTALLADAASGKHIAALEVEGTNSNGQIVYDLTANDVLVSSVQQSNSEGVEPQTAFSFSYAKIGLVTTSITSTDALGDSQSFGWDIAAAKAIAPTSLVTPVAGTGIEVPDPVSYFLRISGISGDSTSKGHEGWFEIPAFSFGASNSGSALSLSAGKVNISDLSVFLTDNAALSALLMDNASGKAIQALEIEGVAANGRTVYDLMLNNVLVSSVAHSDSSGSSAATSATFNFSQIGIVTTSLNPDGTVAGTHEFGWDLAANKAIGGTLTAPVAGTTDPVPDPVAYYLKIDGISGDSTSKGHEGWFEIPAFSIGQSNSGSLSTGGGGGAGAVNFSDLSLYLENNTALASLFSLDANGKVITALEIEGVAANGRTVYDLTLNHVQVSSINHGGADGSGAATAVSFNFGKIGVVTTGVNPDGTAGDVHSYGWDLTTATPIDPVSLTVPVAGAIAEAPSPTQYFLKISGVAGDATSKGYQGWFDLPSFSYNASTPSGGLGGLSGKTSFSDLSLTLGDNTALSALLLDMAAGKGIQALEIEGVTTDSTGARHIVYDLTLNSVLVSGVQQSASVGGTPSTSYSFNYGQIGLVTTSIRPDGTTAGEQQFGWDLIANKAIDPLALSEPTSTATGSAGSPSVYYLKVDGVMGNSTSKGHEGWFEVSALSLGGTNPGAVQTQILGGTGGKVNFGDLSLALSGAGSLTPLMHDNAAGVVIRAIEVEGVNGAGQTVYDLTLNNVIVTSAMQSAASGADGVFTNYSFAFTKIGLVNTVVNPNGSLGTTLKFGWDLATNKAIDPNSLFSPGGQPPSVSVTSQALDHDTGALGSDLVTNDGHVTLTGIASDDGTVTSVHVFDGAVDLGAATLSAGTWTFSTVLDEGTHALHAVATDNTGTTASSATQASIVVDQTAPDLAVIAQVLTADTGVSDSDNVTKDGSVTLSGTVGDGVQLVGVHVFDGATDLGAATLVAGNWTFGTTLGAGAHALTAVATDTAGNTTTSVLQASILVDQAGPSVAVSSQVLTSDTGASGSDLVTNDGRVTLTGTASDDTALASVHLFDGATDLGAATLGADGWTFAATLGAGAHALTAVATDTAGNVTSSVLQAPIVVDQAAPIVAITSQVLTTDTGLSASDLITSDGRVTVSGTIGDNVAVGSVHVFDGSTDLGAATVSGGTWSFSTTLAVGSHALSAVAVDTAGNSAATATQPAINVVQYDPIVGQPGQTTVNGTAHEDTIYFSTTNLAVNAGGGDDLIAIAAGSTFGVHFLAGGAGTDTLDLSGLTTSSTVNLATGVGTGSQLGLALLSGIENVIGGSANDVFTANDARNTFTGGEGADRFVFATLDAARNGPTYSPGSGDVITDFRSLLDGGGVLHDVINLQGIDAIQGKKDDAFTFIATPWDGTGNEFTAAGQLRVQYVTDAQGNEHTLLSGNVNPIGQGNGLAADFTIDLLGHHLLSAPDFVL